MDDLILKFQEFFSAVSQGLRLLSPFKRLVVIVCVVAIIPMYFISKGISSAYWNHKFKPLLLTAHQSFSNPKELAVGPVTVLPFGVGAYSAYVQVTNNNLDLAANHVPYTFNFYNAAHELVYTTQGKTYFVPAQKKYIVTARFSARDEVATGTLTLGQVQWQKRLTIPTLTLEAPVPVQKSEIDPAGGITFALEGTVYNNSPYKLAAVNLIFFLYGSDNKVVEVSQRSEFTLKPYERRAYKQVWPGVLGTDISKVTVFPETNTLESANIQTVE